MKTPNAKEWLESATVIEKKPRVDMFVVGPKMRAMREKADIGLREMARAIGLSGCFLHDIEKGFRNVTPDKLQAYIDFCCKPKPTTESQAKSQP